MSEIVLKGSSIEEILQKAAAMEDQKKTTCRHRNKNGTHAFLPIGESKLMKCEKCGTVINTAYLVDSPEEYEKLTDKLVSNMEFLKTFDKAFDDKEKVIAVSDLIYALYQVAKRQKKTSNRVKGVKKNKGNKSNQRLSTVDRSFNPKEALLRDLKSSGGGRQSGYLR